MVMMTRVEMEELMFDVSVKWWDMATGCNTLEELKEERMMDMIGYIHYFLDMVDKYVLKVKPYKGIQMKSLLWEMEAILGLPAEDMVVTLDVRESDVDKHWEDLCILWGIQRSCIKARIC